MIWVKIIKIQVQTLILIILIHLISQILAYIMLNLVQKENLFKEN